MVAQHQMEDQAYEEADEDGFMSPHDMLLHMPDDYLDSYPDFYNHDEAYPTQTYGIAGISNGYHAGFEYGLGEMRRDEFELDERMAAEEREFLEQEYGRMMGRGMYGGYGPAPPTSPYRS